MKKTIKKAAICFAMAIAALQFSACKKEQPAVNEAPAVVAADTMAAAPAAAPVNIAPDADLETKVQDAVKDFPGVIQTVKDGEVILTGEIARDRLPKLMQSLHALNPKKITNNLTIK